MVWLKSRTGKMIESGLQFLDILVGFGFISGAALAAATGKLILGGFLGALALGVFVRLKRRRNPCPLSRNS